ncbi:MAG: efflux RND transporter periplasmic adaptor subunit [Hyphomicrobiaceae bacterium]|nr:efflux RND transporter periplasmic adaptor subunit [Hyphomicrobiaceae bacterium]
MHLQSSVGRAAAAWVFAAVVLAVGCLPAEAQRRGRGGEPEQAAVSAAEVQIVALNERVAAVGSGRARRQVTVTTRVAGVIDEVLFEGGQKVEAGQPLIRLASAPEAIAVETAEAQRAQAADTVARYDQLNSGTVSRVARAEAETALRVADAALRRAREELDRMTIRAPFAGAVGLTNLQVGDYIAVGTPIAPLDDRSTLIIEFTVPEAVAPEVKKGLAVRANLIARSGEVYQGEVQATGTRIDPVSRTMNVRAELPNPDNKLIPGSTFSISLQLAGRRLPQVPGLAVQWDRQGAYVWRLNGDNTVERVDAAIVSRDGEFVLLDAKLQAGDKVVREGGDTLRKGQVVRLQSS